MHTIPSSTIQTAVRQAALLLGSGIYGVGDIIKRWEATDPKVTPVSARTRRNSVI
jgi:hypothetical protein